MNKEEALILVPKNLENTNVSSICKASGIVASPLEPDDKSQEISYVVDYEGNLYNACNLKSIVQRIYHALDRQKSQYPTTARKWVTHEELNSKFLIVGRVNREVMQQSRAYQEADDAKCLQNCQSFGLYIEPEMKKPFESWAISSQNPE